MEAVIRGDMVRCGKGIVYRSKGVLQGVRRKE